MSASPFRPPDWRWKLAGLTLVERLPRRPEVLDPWVQRIARYLRSTNGDDRPHRRRRVAHDPLLAQVAAIRFSADRTIPAELEAWILTGEPPVDVVEYSGWPLTLVEAYEACCFDVRARLEASSYINHIVIGPAIYRGFSLDDIGTLWKFFGYYRGRYTLASLLQTFPGSRTRPWPHWYSATPAERERVRTICRRAVQVFCLPKGNLGPRELELLLQLKSEFEAEQEECFDPDRDGIVNWIEFLVCLLRGSARGELTMTCSSFHDPLDGRGRGRESA
jgi:hypothetical protein